MSLMDWSDSLDIGVHAMNDQHKIILKLMNTLHDAHTSHKPFSEFIGPLDELKNYTVQHFAEEEAYMESIQFEGLKTHKIIHQDLLNKFSEHYENITKEKKLDPKFFDFLKIWLTSHIKGIDIKYGQASCAQKKSA